MPVKKITNEILNTELLNPYPTNPRKHTDDKVNNFAQYVKSLSSETSTGMIDQIIIDENNMILAGHKRALAALKNNITTVDCRRVIGLTESEKRAYIIANNQFTFDSEWDYELLKVELTALKSEDVELTTLGFKNDDFNNDIPLDDFEFKPPNENPPETLKPIQLIITFTSEEDQKKLFDELLERGYKVKA